MSRITLAALGHGRQRHSGLPVAGSSTSWLSASSCVPSAVKGCAVPACRVDPIDVLCYARCLISLWLRLGGRTDRAMRTVHFAQWADQVPGTTRPKGPRQGLFGAKTPDEARLSALAIPELPFSRVNMNV